MTYVVVTGIVADVTTTFAPVPGLEAGSLPRAGIDAVFATVVTMRVPDTIPTLPYVVIVCLIGVCSFDFCGDWAPFIGVATGNRAAG